ncbi:hypothetical protein FNV43_RR25279 [Rhamnella rubrinervis]|uniref:Alcohol dehydrogenase n=1 Tax=Rhamnella rubrinervis TaxID=2594499 RepID=A0A8K0DSV1_9ROSA|nr:hypothetical protein FNV43_RR25279 [Rhamnella rubrinervis]
MENLQNGSGTGNHSSTETTGKVITCNAAVVWGPEQPFVMEEVRVQPPQKMEVRIKIHFTSICHTDLSAWKGEDISQRAYPRILGHEASGEYTVLDSACVVNITTATTLSLKNMSLLSCGVSTGVGAAWNTANVQPGSTVAVFGLGAVGLAVAEGARARGASKIIGVDINPSKFTKVEPTMCVYIYRPGNGVTHFINPGDLQKPVHERVREMTEGGVDYSFECAGNLDVLREAFLSTHEGWGFTVTLGIHPTPRMLPIHPMELFNGRSIVGSVFGGFKGKTQLPLFAKQCMSGMVDLDKFITHELPFDKINDAMQLLIEGKSLRCILHI